MTDALIAFFVCVVVAALLTALWLVVDWELSRRRMLRRFEQDLDRFGRDIRRFNAELERAEKMLEDDDRAERAAVDEEEKRQ